MFGFRSARHPAGHGACVPDGQRVYAVGDVHGRADLLDRMAGLIDADLAREPAREVLTIFLGDYVDRGPASAQIVDRLARGDFPTPIVTLKGNHEDLFERFLAGGLDWSYYDQLGGHATLRSYDLDPDDLEAMIPARAEAELRAAVPPTHRAFLAATELSRTIGDYFFCHAGVRPGVPLDRQSRHDLIWIREEFLHSSDDLGKVVVHGHTPARRPEVRPNRIGIDTMAYASGVLTALVLEGTARRFLQT